jgi:hypothetical protein
MWDEIQICVVPLGIIFILLLCDKALHDIYLLKNGILPQEY